MRKQVVVAVAAAGVALGLAATPASADTALVTLSVGLDTNTLSIAAPTAVVVPGDPATATIATTVSDLRLSGGNWTATISATDLTLTGTSETIPATSMTAYASVTTAPLLGTATLSTPYASSSSTLALTNTAQPFVSTTARSNANTTIYNTIVSIPTTGKTAGVYTGNVVQSVS
jgi:hypothetical protein